MTKDLVTFSDCRNSGVFCCAGGKIFCDKNGFSWKELVTKGLPIEDLAKLDDIVVNRIIDTAKVRIDGERKQKTNGRV